MPGGPRRIDPRTPSETICAALIAEAHRLEQGRVCDDPTWIDEGKAADRKSAGSRALLDRSLTGPEPYCVSVEVRSMRQLSCSSLAPGTSFTRRSTIVPRLEGRPSAKSITIGAS